MSIFSKNKCVVLMYHRVRERLPEGRLYPNIINTVFADDFKKQIAYLKSRYNILSKDEFVSCLTNGGNFPERSILITFDDGQSDLYVHAYPVLKKRSVPAIIFLSTDYIGTDRVFWWDELEYYMLNSSVERIQILGSMFERDKARISYNKIASQMGAMQPEERGELLDKIKKMLKVSGCSIGKSALTWDEVKEMAGSNISFQPHTKNHLLLSTVSEQEAREEICGSKNAIEQKLGIKTDIFAFPCGNKSAFSKSHEVMVEEAGFKAAFSTYEGVVCGDSGLYSLPRLGISGTYNMLIFKVIVSSFPHIFKRLVRKSGDVWMRINA